MREVAKTQSSAMRAARRKKLAFYWIVLALPVLQFCVFYIGVNVNSLFMAFQEYDFESGRFAWEGFSSMRLAFTDLFTQKFFVTAAKNSLIVYAVSLLIGITLALIFSFFIYKKMPGAGLYKVILFMPQIVSVVVIVILYKYCVERAVPALVELFTGEVREGLLANPDTRFGTLLFFTVWAGFGTQVLMFTGAMGGISDSVVDAARIDGASAWQEFFFVTIPSVYPTLITFLTVGVAHIFTNQMNLYSFYGTQADYDLYTFGYFLYKSVQETKSMANYPYLASFSLIFTFCAVPLTFAVRALLVRFGPKTE